MSKLDLLPALDYALRGGAVAALLLLAALLLRDHRGVTAARLGAAFALGAAAHVVCSVPALAAPEPWQAPLRALAAGNTILFWLFARALFDDEFELRRWHGAAWAALAATGAVNCLLLVPSRPVAADAVGLALNLATLAFAALAVAQTLATWRADLVERRRRLRTFIVAAVSAYTVVMVALRIALHGGPPSPAVGVIDAGGIAALVLAISWPLLGVRGGGLFAEPAPGPAAAAQRAEPPRARPASDDEPLAAALERLMGEQRIYRHESLTVGTLAERLSVPEHRLRRLINQRLGHRNFNVFVNRYRIEDVKRALADPAQRDMPVLNLAMVAGFQSLGPFNRAFKAQTGLTPTEFRRGLCSDGSLALADSEIG